ncbi:epoxyqueuosine reductase [Labilibacter sediminis]|nr:epoxyqueuosine reductase [Labilibacter sediminis]
MKVRMGNLLRERLQSQGVNMIHFVDISGMSPNQNRGFSSAILLGMTLSLQYLKIVSNSDDYVGQMKMDGLIDQDEFHLKELATDRIADELAKYITDSGYEAFSQSENNLLNEGVYNEKYKSTPLPHKTIALMAGLGWIGKNNLLVTPEYGCAISMCSVLTNSPLNTVWNLPTKSQCGDCSICENNCNVDALKGQTWGICASRDRLIDVFKCTTCLKCMVNCRYTQAYVTKELGITC